MVGAMRRMHRRLKVLSILVSLFGCHLIIPPLSMVPFRLAWEAVVFRSIEGILPEASHHVTVLSLGVLGLASLSFRPRTMSSSKIRSWR